MLHIRNEPRSPSRCRQDDGIAILLVALLAVVLLVVAAFAIDLGQLYAQRRQTQNGTDSAAMAGARAIDQVRFKTPTPDQPDTIYTAIRRSITEHLEGQTGEFHCWLTGTTGERLLPTADACASAAAMTSAFNSLTTGPRALSPVAGVEVSARQTRATFLARVVGQKQTTAETSAAATIQPYLGGTGSPFVVCGVKAADSTSYDIMKADGTLVDGVVGQSFAIQGSQVPTCGANSSAKGLNGASTIVVGKPCPSSLPPFSPACDMTLARVGNRFDGEVSATVAGAVPCTAAQLQLDAPPCDLLVPIADYGYGNGNGNGPEGPVRFHIVGWVVMHVTPGPNGQAKYIGEVLGGSNGVITGGTGSTSPVTSSGTPRVIKLVK